MHSPYLTSAYYFIVSFVKYSIAEQNPLYFDAIINEHSLLQILFDEYYPKITQKTKELICKYV